MADVNLAPAGWDTQMWRQTLQRPLKRKRIQVLLDRGGLSLPKADGTCPPWDCTARLCGPYLSLPNENPVYQNRRRRKKGMRLELLNTYIPRAIYAGLPPYSRIRLALANAVAAAEWVDQVVLDDLCTSWPLQVGACERVIDLINDNFGLVSRYGTRNFLQLLRSDMLAFIQRQRTTALANGRWWPAPVCIQLVLRDKGCISARIQFADGFQPPGNPWIEWIGHKTRLFG